MLNTNNFLTSYMIASNNGLDARSADRLAILMGLMDMSQMQTAVLTSLLAGSALASTSSSQGATPTLSRRRRGRALAGPIGAPKVKVPSVDNILEPGQIREYLQQRKLRARIHLKAIQEIRTPRVLHQWPEADADVDEGAEVHVMLLVPEEGRHGEPEARLPRK
jgi:hypothetical protein